MNKDKIYSDLEKFVDKWKKENKIDSTEVIKNLLVYSVILVARVGEKDYEVEGEVNGGVEDLNETYAFEFKVNKIIETEKEPLVLN